MSESWRTRQLRGEERSTGDEHEDPLPERKKRRVMDTMWGQGEQTEEQTRRSAWLVEPVDVHVTTGTAKQALLKTWTWLELEARKVLVELADRVERSSMERKEEEKREQERLEDLEIEMSEHQQLPHQAVVVSDRHASPVISKEQDIRILMARQTTIREKEHAREERLAIGLQKKEALLTKLQPWNWIKFEAKKVIEEIADQIEQTAIEQERLRKEQRQREQKEKLKEKIKKKQLKVKGKKKPWSWLTIEARKIVLELVSQIERKGRIKIGEQKKKDLLDQK